MANSEVTFDLSAFAKAIDGGLKTVVQKLALDIHSKLVKKTPVDTGRARASWMMSFGGADLSVPPAGKHAPPGPPAIAANITGKEQVWVASNLDYIEFLEQGTSKQAPLGMVTVTMAEIEVELEHLITQLV